ncbi:hypothetical protein SUNI508_09628 [Seiridium unicorne]|uniref:GAR domain-containing protein n=1 Tax=Seiridium unicorne TaxID=138068 RepID=A0ABR2UPD9_9PEZI
MADPRSLAPTPSPGHRSATRRPLRSTSQSPSRQRLGDALLSHLTPASAVEALKAPSGPLKGCLEEASPSEQHFAMRTAIASKKIYDWLDELLDWPWPKETTYAGFELPPAKRRKLSEPREPERGRNLARQQLTPSKPETDYMGSLPASDVARYEIRIEQVQKGLDELDLEEIKSHVLLNHIMPLSRPGTPFSDAGRSTASSISFTKLEDIAAVITAITIQALPNLSRLTRLLNTWSIRIIVLRKVPSVLMLITDAEVALKSGWNAIEVEKPAGHRTPERLNTSALPRKDFEVMNSVLRQKVAQPGRDLDYMLDVLEGMADTLPDSWLDRMDDIEKDYANWVATAERRVQKGEWGEVESSSKSDTRQTIPQTPGPKIQIQTPSPARNRHEEGTADSGLRILVKAPSEDIPRSVDQVLDLSENAAHQRAVDSELAVEDSDSNTTFGNDELPRTAVSDMDGSPIERRKARDFDGSVDRAREPKTSTALSEVDRNILRITPPEVLSPSPKLYRKSIPDLEAEYSFLESVHEEEEDEDEDEPQLPPARFVPRRDSQESMASTVLHDPASAYDHSDDPFQEAAREGSMEPELPRLPDPDEPFSSDAISPPSSPPLRYKPRTTSVSFNEIPDISEMPEEETTPPRSPLEPPEIFDHEASFDYGAQFSSPGHMSVASEPGDDLHQQIRQVLKGLPNKIRLSTKPSAINLNPPDLQLPTRAKPRVSEPFRRSGSALSTRSTMSSRASTPSWLLAPARAPRPQSRASHDTKTYYLSRSSGEAPMKLLIRCVGENGERVMVRVGGGWADLGEYLKEYAIHHSRRSKGEGKVEVRDSSTLQAGKTGSSPPSRPGSALDAPTTPLLVRKTRKTPSEEGSSRRPVTPSAQSLGNTDIPSSDKSVASHDSRVQSNPNSSILGMSGPHPKKTRTLDDESRQWVEDMRNKVRTASGEQRTALEQAQNDGKFGEIGKAGGTKRVFRKHIP